ncbi:hypothetical protein AAFN86_11150 [Roseomonas sp. CAU 1739]|uniref:hypothetical protein n=1 Tax=Roseomonas sp. CAU 1739 TaxID=3140364 RepID=UPI00325A9827
MTAGAARDRLRAWFTEQVQVRSDGFLVRPLGRLGRVIVLPDEDTVAQHVTRRASLTLRELAGRCVFFSFLFAAVATVLLDFRAARALFGSATSFALPLTAIFGVVTGATWLARWQIYRWACRIGHRVSHTQWRGTPPSEAVPIPLLPGWFVAFNVALVGLVGPAFAGSMAWNFPQFSMDGSLGLVAWLSLALGIGCCWTVAILIARQWWRANGRA